MPPGIPTEPHANGGLRVLDVAAYRRAKEFPLLPEARQLAELYALILSGNPIGQAGAMGGLIPEKLQWITVDAACRRLGLKLNRWQAELLFSIDAIRLDAEFKRLEEAAKRNP